jgi:hypothetical protein
VSESSSCFPSLPFHAAPAHRSDSLSLAFSRLSSASGTCAVEVDGPVLPKEWNAQESLRLRLPPHSGRQGLRLACQIAVQGDLVVRKRDGGWGQGAELVAERTDGVASFLGDLEYVFDRTSPPELPCPACSGTELVPCPLCDGGADVERARSCSACTGSGQVVCRSCFSGNPWDLQETREKRATRPD